MLMENCTDLDKGHEQAVTFPLSPLYHVVLVYCVMGVLYLINIALIS